MSASKPAAGGPARAPGTGHGPVQRRVRGRHAYRCDLDWRTGRALGPPDGYGLDAVCCLVWPGGGHAPGVRDSLIRSESARSVATRSVSWVTPSTPIGCFLRL